MKESSGRKLLMLVLLILLVACSSTSQPPAPAPTARSTARLSAPLTPVNGGGTGRIALACAPDVAHADVDISVSNLDGSDMHRLTNGPGPELSPSWSPDGKKIAFTSHRTGHTEVYVMNAGGSGLHELTTSQPGSSSGGPDWSPDGIKILFLRSLPNSGENWIMNSDGSAQTKLSDTYGFGDAPVWQPKTGN